MKLKWQDWLGSNKTDEESTEDSNEESTEEQPNLPVEEHGGSNSDALSDEEHKDEQPMEVPALCDVYDIHAGQEDKQVKEYFQAVKHSQGTSHNDSLEYVSETPSILIIKDATTENYPKNTSVGTMANPQLGKKPPDEGTKVRTNSEENNTNKLEKVLIELVPSFLSLKSVLLMLVAYGCSRGGKKLAFDVFRRIQTYGIIIQTYL